SRAGRRLGGALIRPRPGNARPGRPRGRGTRDRDARGRGTRDRDARGRGTRDRDARATDRLHRRRDRRPAPGRAGRAARTARRPAGLADAWVAEAESCDEVLEHLLAHGVDGKRVAVQLHGEAQPELCGALAAAGADVVEVSVYRWLPPADPTPLRRIVDLAVN